MKLAAKPDPSGRSMFFLGAGAVILACLAFGSNSIFVKIVAARHDPWTISLVRFLVGAGLSSLGILITQKRHQQALSAGFRVQGWSSMVGRAVFGCAQMVLFFVGVALTSSGRATLLMCTHPIFAALFGLIIFGERLPKAVFVGILAGFVGALVVFWDGSSYSLAGNLVSLAGGAANGMAMHFVRRVRQNHTAFMVYLAPSVLGVAITAFAFPRLFALSAGDLTLMLLIGSLSFVGQFLIGYGLKFIPATAGSMLGLSEIVFALTLSAAFLGEAMLPRFFLGTGIILMGLVLTALVIQRSQRQASA